MSGLVWFGPGVILIIIKYRPRAAGRVCKKFCNSSVPFFWLVISAGGEKQQLQPPAAVFLFSWQDDANIIDSIINEAIMRLGKKYLQEDFEEILKSDKFKFKVSLESFCEAPDGSRISGFVGADFFYEVVQAGINEKELLAELLAEELRSSSKSTNPKKLASSKKSQNEKKSSSGDTLYYCLVLHFQEGNCLQRLL